MSFGAVRSKFGAPQRGALCVCGGLSLLFLSVAAVAADVPCRAQHHDEEVRVRHVVDGDTVVLVDGRHVRLIGFNAPERASKRRAAEPFAEQARTLLRRSIDRVNGPLLLQYGPERFDRYGRTLAHLFLPDGEHLGAHLLRQGFAAAIAVPPNLGFQDCLRAAERDARERDLGVWSVARFTARAVSQLDDREPGFVRVRGRLDGIAFSGDALWLQIERRLGVRIHKSDLRHFRRWNFHALRGKEMVVRGWVWRQRGGWRMQLKHPNDLELVEP